MSYRRESLLFASSQYQIDELGHPNLTNQWKQATLHTFLLGYRPTFRWNKWRNRQDPTQYFLGQVPIFSAYPASPLRYEGQWSHFLGPTHTEVVLMLYSPSESTWDELTREEAFQAVSGGTPRTENPSFWESSGKKERRKPIRPVKRSYLHCCSVKRTVPSKCFRPRT